MNIFRAFSQAAIGWLDIISGRPAWRERFDQSYVGLVGALVWYFIVVLASLLLQIALGGSAAPAQAISTIAINALPVAGVAVATALFVLILRAEVGFAGLLVPAVYAMTFLLILGLPLGLINLPVGPLLLGLLGYLLYRTGRVVGGFNIPLAIAFGALCLVLLVALPLSIYMLVAQGQVPN